MLLAATADGLTTERLSAELAVCRRIGKVRILTTMPCRQLHKICHFSIPLIAIPKGPLVNLSPANPPIIVDLQTM